MLTVDPESKMAPSCGMTVCVLSSVTVSDKIVGPWCRVCIAGRQLDDEAAPDTTEELEQADRLSCTGSGLLLIAAGAAAAGWGRRGSRGEGM
jgi:hypothetical protein